MKEKEKPKWLKLDWVDKILKKENWEEQKAVYEVVYRSVNIRFSYSFFSYATNFFGLLMSYSFCTLSIILCQPYQGRSDRKLYFIVKLLH